MSKRLPEGFGTPYVEVFSGSGKLLRYSNGLSLGLEVVDFVYEETEESDDNCRITFESHTGQLADLLVPDTVIYVRWGYRETTWVSQKRLLAIRDTLTKYSMEGVAHTLICTDKASYLKTIQLETVNTENFIDWLKGVNSTKFHQIKIKAEPKAIGASGTSPVIFDYGTTPSYVDGQGTNIKAAIDNTAVARANKTIVPAGGSIWKVIRDEVDASDDGPYVMDGRDDQLDIRKRNFDQGVIRSYAIRTENGDEVISFEPETRIREHDVELANYAVTNEGDNSTESTTEFNQDPVSIKNSEYYRSLDPYEKKTYELVKTLKDVYDMDPEKGANIDPNDVISSQWENISNLSTETPDYVEETGGIKIAVDNTATIIRKITIPKSIYWSSEEAAEILEKIITNQIKDDHYKKYQATLTVMGDPGIRVNKCIYVAGKIANRHKGKYYVTSVKHSIGKGGYICEIGLLKNPPPISFVKSKYINPLEEAWGKKSTGQTTTGDRVDTNQTEQPSEAKPEEGWENAHSKSDANSFRKFLYEQYGEKGIR